MPGTPNTATRYGVIIADPPWKFSDKLGGAEGIGKSVRGAEAMYGCLSIREISRIPVEEWAAKDSLLVLWSVGCELAGAAKVMADWGFVQKGFIVWVKTLANGGGLATGLGRQFRGASEIALWGTRGRPKPVRKPAIPNVFHCPRLEHSRKPETVAECLERMYPDALCLELFARRWRESSPRR